MSEALDIEEVARRIAKDFAMAAVFHAARKIIAEGDSHIEMRGATVERLAALEREHAERSIGLFIKHRPALELLHREGRMAEG